jgi:hypothetical protein
MMKRIQWLFVLAFLFSFKSAFAQGKRNVEIGVFVEDVYGLDYQNSKYEIIFWLWVNTDTIVNFEENFDLSNCADIQISSVTYDSNDSGTQVHSECKIIATILNKFDVVDYPFDEQKIKLRLELTEFTDVHEYNFVFDRKSVLKPEFMHDWTVKETNADFEVNDYKSTFGNYLYPESSFLFPGLDLEMTLVRDSWNLFFKSFLTLFVSVVLASISMFYPNSCSEEKMGLIVGSLFTAVGNKYVTDGNLPLSNFNLSDKLHLLTIVLITLIALFAIVEQRLRIKDNLKLDLTMFTGTLILFTLSVASFTISALN